MSYDRLTSNLKRITLAAYLWICENYQHGDCIFLFGEIFTYATVEFMFKVMKGFRVAHIKYELLQE